MGKKQKKKGHGAEKTALKTEKKAMKKAKKEARGAGEDDIEAIVASLEAAEVGKLTPVSEVAVGGRPSPRSSFSWTPHAKAEEVHLFGGECRVGGRLLVYNDHYVYRLPSNSWVRLGNGTLPTPRCSHQAAVVKAAQQTQLYVFGGEFASPNETQFHHYGDMWAWNVKTRQWRRLLTDGPGPCPRSGHRMAALRRSLFVFGGFQDSGRSYRYLNDLWQWSCELAEWTELRAASPPSGRSACLLFPLPSDAGLCVVGGYAKRTENKVERGVVHTDSYALQLGGKGCELGWRPIKFSGPRPTPRCGVSGCVNPDTGRAYLFGGVFDIEEADDSMTSVMFNELYQLDLSKQRWRLVDYSQPSASRTDDSGDAASAAETTAAAAAAAADANASELAACVPLERMNCGLAVLQHQLLLFAGQNEDEDSGRTRVLDDMHCIDLRQLRCWQQLQADSSGVAGVAGVASDSDADEDDEEGKEEEDDDEGEDEDEGEEASDSEGAASESEPRHEAEASDGPEPPAVADNETMDAYCQRAAEAWRAIVQSSLSRCWPADLVTEALVAKYARRAAKDFYRHRRR